MSEKFDVNNFESQLTPNRTTHGNCSGCVLRNFSYLCSLMACVDDDYHQVYWTLRHGTEWDVPAVFNDARGRKLNIRKICLQKIAQEYSR